MYSGISLVADEHCNSSLQRTRIEEETKPKYGGTGVHLHRNKLFMDMSQAIQRIVVRDGIDNVLDGLKKPNEFSPRIYNKIAEEMGMTIDDHTGSA